MSLLFGSLGASRLLKEPINLSSVAYFLSSNICLIHNIATLVLSRGLSFRENNLDPLTLGWLRGFSENAKSKGGHFDPTLKKRV